MSVIVVPLSYGPLPPCCDLNCRICLTPLLPFPPQPLLDDNSERDSGNNHPSPYFPPCHITRCSTSFACTHTHTDRWGMIGMWRVGLGWKVWFRWPPQPPWTGITLGEREVTQEIRDNLKSSPSLCHYFQVKVRKIAASVMRNFRRWSIFSLQLVCANTHLSRRGACLYLVCAQKVGSGTG